MIDKYNLKFHNTADQPNTFCRLDGHTSNIDVTLSTENIGNTVRDWSVRDLTDSDHRVISYSITVAKNVKPASYEKL